MTDADILSLYYVEFMSVAPWYMNTGTGPSLKHQKAPLYNADPSKLQERFSRGTKAVSSRYNICCRVQDVAQRISRKVHD